MLSKKELWFRRRGYTHFDRPVSYLTASKIVTDPQRVAKRGFLPFIDFDIITSKVKWCDDLRRLVRKSKPRKVAYASHIDSHIFSYYCHLLTSKYEGELNKRGLSTNVLAFRTLGKSNINFAAEAFSAITEHGECHVLGLDIRGFFDNLDHAILKSQWASVLGLNALPHDHYAVFRALTRYSMVNLDATLQLLGVSKHNRLAAGLRLCSPEDFREKIRSAKIIRKHSDVKGIPQGSSISALLSNIYMLDFDERMARYVESVSGKYFRYCDDMLFIVPPSEALNCEKLVADYISRIRLEVQPAKTERRDFKKINGYLWSEKPLQYLGFLFDGQRVLLRSASLARYSDRLRRGVRLAKATMRKRNQLRIARGGEPRPLFMKSLLKKYTYFGRRNFISYGYRAAQHLDSNEIRKQLRPLWNKFQKELMR